MYISDVSLYAPLYPHDILYPHYPLVIQHRSGQWPKHGDFPVRQALLVTRGSDSPNPHPSSASSSLKPHRLVKSPTSRSPQDIPMTSMTIHHENHHQHSPANRHEQVGPEAIVVGSPRSPIASGLPGLSPGARRSSWRRFASWVGWRPAIAPWRRGIGDWSCCRGSVRVDFCHGRFSW